MIRLKGKSFYCEVATPILITGNHFLVKEHRSSDVMDVEYVRVRQVIQRVSLDEIGRDEELTYIETRAILLLEVTN